MRTQEERAELVTSLREAVRLSGVLNGLDDEIRLKIPVVEAAIRQAGLLTPVCVELERVIPAREFTQYYRGKPILRQAPERRFRLGFLGWMRFAGQYKDQLTSGAWHLVFEHEATIVLLTQATREIRARALRALPQLVGQMKGEMQAQHTAKEALLRWLALAPAE